LLGILDSDPDAWFTQAVGSDPSALSEAAIESLIEERLSARGDRNFARADEIRDLLEEQGVVLEDGADGTLWRRRR
jgi:cysteinyl-tRNA synthetase